MFTKSRIAATAAVLGLTGLGVLASPAPALAWWHGGWGGVRVGVALPPLVVAPPYYAPPPTAYYAPPPAYYTPSPYAPPARVWVPGHWRGGYWVPAHWA
jgi:hypothetical protein